MRNGEKERNGKETKKKHTSKQNTKSILFVMFQTAFETFT